MIKCLRCKSVPRGGGMHVLSAFCLPCGASHAPLSLFPSHMPWGAVSRASLRSFSKGAAQPARRVAAEEPPKVPTGTTECTKATTECTKATTCAQATDTSPPCSAFLLGPAELAEPVEMRCLEASCACSGAERNGCMQPRRKRRLWTRKLPLQMLQRPGGLLAGSSHSCCRLIPKLCLGGLPHNESVNKCHRCEGCLHLGVIWRGGCHVIGLCCCRLESAADLALLLRFGVCCGLSSAAAVWSLLQIWLCYCDLESATDLALLLPFRVCCSLWSAAAVWSLFGRPVATGL